MPPRPSPLDATREPRALDSQCVPRRLSPGPAASFRRPRRVAPPSQRNARDFRLLPDVRARSSIDAILVTRGQHQANHSLLSTPADTFFAPACSSSPREVRSLHQMRGATLSANAKNCRGKASVPWSQCLVSCLKRIYLIKLILHIHEQLIRSSCSSGLRVRI